MIEEIEIPPSSNFVGHGYVQRVGSEWRRGQCVRYDTYPIPDNQDVPNSIFLHIEIASLLGPVRTRLP